MGLSIPVLLWNWNESNESSLSWCNGYILLKFHNSAVESSWWNTQAAWWPQQMAAHRPAFHFFQQTVSVRRIIVLCSVKGEVFLLAFKDKNISKSCNFFFACSVQIYHRQKGSSSGPTGVVGGRRGSLFWSVCCAGSSTSPHRECSEGKCFKKSDAGFLIRLSKHYFFAPPFLSPPFTIHTTLCYTLVLTRSLKNETKCLHGCFIFVIQMDFTGANKDRT